MTAVLIIDSALAAATALARDLASAHSSPRRDTRDLDVMPLANFSSARARLLERPPALLVTALRLHEYNGLHLVYVAAAHALPTRCVVHTDAVDPMQAREVRAAGAFYETRARLPVALPAYVSAVLPPQDRRDTIPFDRRHLSRGGRRAADQHPAI